MGTCGRKEGELVTRRCPRLLDLFCKAGGAGMGYSLAGFEVIGVDIAPQPHYPFPFIQADALEVSLEGFDAYHASPPCQFASRCRFMRQNEGRVYPELVAPIRERLQATGKPYIIENVPLAPLRNPMVLCGQMFGLRVLRHRLFESNILLLAPPHQVHRGLRWRHDFVTVAGHMSGQKEWAEAMGIDWMQTHELTQAIPPAYTAHLGRQLRAAVAS